MLLGCAHVSKTDGFQSLDLQRDSLGAAGIDTANPSTTTSGPASGADGPLIRRR
ncbi:MAG: hypothetical protein OXG35_07745 [Acidobacteria bacterium]|nr:hypothetical protein [Acidobacteriota bacterium]